MLFFWKIKLPSTQLEVALRIKWFEIYSSVVFEKMFVVYSKNIHAM